MALSKSGLPSPLYGLVLAGGSSRRMGRPKWEIDYHGKPEAARVADLLAPICERVFLSVREEEDGGQLPRLPRIPDSAFVRGPVAGLLSAMERHPQAAWLVVACDLPFLGEGTLRVLVENRSPFAVATAFRSAHGGLPEPLCAIWEPSSVALIQEALRADTTCPRRILMGSDPRLLDLPDPRALDNVNTPDEHLRAVADLRAERARGASTH